MWGEAVWRTEQGTAVSTCKVPEAQVSTAQGAQAVGSTALEKSGFSPSRLAGSVQSGLYLPPHTPLFMAPLSLFAQSSPTFEAWLWGTGFLMEKV